MLTPEVKDSPSRMARLVKAGREVLYPDAPSFLVGLLKDIGLSTPNGPLTWVDLQAWQSITRQTIHPGEAETILAASERFALSLRKFDAKIERAPFGYVEEFNKAMEAMIDQSIMTANEGRK